jgi:hypothetical protein
VSEVIRRWAAAGLSAAGLEALGRAAVQVADLEDGYLGKASPQQWGRGKGPSPKNLDYSRSHCTTAGVTGERSHCERSCKLSRLETARKSFPAEDRAVAGRCRGREDRLGAGPRPGRIDPCGHEPRLVTGPDGWAHGPVLARESVAGPHRATCMVARPSGPIHAHVPGKTATSPAR